MSSSMSMVWFSEAPSSASIATYIRSQTWSERLSIGVRWRSRTEGVLRRGSSLPELVEALEADDVGFYSVHMGQVGERFGMTGRFDDLSGSHFLQISSDENPGIGRVDYWFDQPMLIGAFSTDLLRYRRDSGETDREVSFQPPKPRWVIVEPPTGWPRFVAYPAQAFWLRIGHIANQGILKSFADLKEHPHHPGVSEISVWRETERSEEIARKQAAFVECYFGSGP